MTDKNVPHELAGLRLDQVLPLLFPGHSRSELQRLIQNGDVRLNNALPKKRHLVESGDCVSLVFSPKPQDHIIPQAMAFEILFEDESIFVINKPAGLVVHPAPGNWEGTFVNGLLAHCDLSDHSDPIRPGIVHRLDKETSGVLVAAKTTAALNALCQQFHDRVVQKEYLAIVTGTFEGKRDVHAPIGRDPKHRHKMAIVEAGKEASTQFASICHSRGLSLIKALPHTGRTHQIRIHLSSLGFPVLGDILYGQPDNREKWGISRHMLHCERITLTHPISHTALTFFAPIPNDMGTMIQKSDLTLSPHL